MSYLINDILETSWLGIRKSYSKHHHLSIRFLWCLKSKDYIHNCDMNQPDLPLGIITIQGFLWINSVNSFSKEHLLSILSVFTLTAIGSTILII